MKRANTTQRSWDNYVDPQTGVMGQSTQRSWDNYVGDNPIKSWKGQSPQGEARFYASSERWGPGGSGLSQAMDDLMDEEEENSKKKRRRRSESKGLSEYDTMRIKQSPLLIGGDELLA